MGDGRAPALPGTDDGGVGGGERGCGQSGGPGGGRVCQCRHPGKCLRSDVMWSQEAAMMSQLGVPECFLWEVDPVTDVSESFTHVLKACLFCTS